MKAFLVGLLFLLAVGVFMGIGVFLYPLIIVLGVFLRVFVGFALVLGGIWLLGKFILYVWEKVKKEREG
ncbi:MAG: hypothetical protein KKC84_07345 [Candidatus Omnitrophica bacterium]|nr:hypothetical protein [Candidatus Omnitrophota bacterium]